MRNQCCPSLFGFCEFLDHPFPSFPVAAEPGFKEIGKKDQFQYDKDQEKLDRDNDPKFPACGHVPEALKIEGIYAFNDLQSRLKILPAKNTYID
jgi:hypothetical protein